MPENRDLAGWLTYLDRLNPQHIRLGLERIERVWRRMDLAPPGKKRLLVGGTNGKGSCVEMLRRLGIAANMRVGCYTSPHLIRFSERIRLPEGEASEAQICAAFRRVEQIKGEDPLSWFEFTTLAAFDLLARADLDLAVLEIGLGGRLDAVNILDADAAVITGVALDHCHILGDSREAIGAEKAAIYRAGCIAVCGDEQPPQAVVERINAVGAQGIFAGQDYRWGELDGQHWQFCCPLGGQHILPQPQLPLAPCAAAITAFGALYPSASAKTWERALLGAFLPGRGQYISGEPDLLLDVAHNAQAVQRLASVAAPHLSERKVHWILGAMKDKDLPGLVTPLADCPAAEAVWYPVAVDSAAPRAASEQQLAEVIRGCGRRCEIIGGGVQHVLQQVLQRAGADDLVGIYGSFYTLGEVMQLLSSQHGYSPQTWNPADPAPLAA